MSKQNYVWIDLTVLCSGSSISGAIQPSVPAAPERLEKEMRPTANFLHNPKSEIIARTLPSPSGCDISTLCGFISLWTARKTHYDYNLYMLAAVSLHDVHFLIFSHLYYLKALGYWKHWSLKLDFGLRFLDLGLISEHYSASTKLQCTFCIKSLIRGTCLIQL